MRNDQQPSNIFTKNILSFIGILTIVVLSSCSTTKQFKDAKRFQDMGEYELAATKYRKVYKKEKSLTKKGEIAFRMAECYRYIGEYRRAEPYYKTAIARDYPDSITRRLYADMLLANEKTEKATKQYEHHLKYHPRDRKAQNGLQSSMDSEAKTIEGSRIQVQKMKTINSSTSDYGAVYLNGKSNEIVFTSTRAESVGKRNSNITGTKNGDLFVSWFDVQRQKWEKPIPLDLDQIINTTNDEGTTSFAANGSELYFTRAKYEKSNESTARIFVARGAGDDWSDPTLVTLGGDSLMAAHPCVSIDGKTIYFVSDRTGGFGGKDIWRSTKNGNAWSRPENLGEDINTPGDEMFPFIRENGELYFSSNYHPGFGGLDIFKAVYDEEEFFWNVENMQSPMNSSGDDFSVFFIPGEDRGLFSTRRKGTRHDDIFSFLIPPIVYSIKGEVTDKETGERIKEATVRIVGTDGTMKKINARNGKFEIDINPESEYIVAAYKDGYLNAKRMENTIGLNDSKEFKINLELTATDAPIEVDNIFFSFGEFNLLPSSQSSLDSLVSILTNNPTIQIELMAHTDSKGEALYNTNLSQRRAQSVVAYLVASGISHQRLVAKGYGESSPKIVNKKIAELYPFLEEGDKLTEEFILTKSETDQEICNQINRRMEFRILSNNYREKY